MENEKYLFVVSGAAGTGKDSVVSALRKAHPEIEKTVSATTRSPRPGEQEGVDYYYRTKEQFQQLIDQDEVVEHNFFNGNYYGTLKEEVNKRLNAGKLVVMVIDVHGAANIRRMYPGATTIFLLPPSTQELERRLRGRGTETEESIRERLEIARNELAQQDKFTLKLVNDEVDAGSRNPYWREAPERFDPFFYFSKFLQENRALFRIQLQSGRKGGMRTVDNTGIQCAGAAVSGAGLHGLPPAGAGRGRCPGSGTGDFSGRMAGH